MAEKLPQLSALFDYLQKMPAYLNAAHGESESIKQVISSKIEVANNLAQENNLLKNELCETRRRFDLSEGSGQRYEKAFGTTQDWSCMTLTTRGQLFIPGKTNLSGIMGMKITNDNPDIADLSDENRPTNIAVMYSELYDNQWSDAYEKLKTQMSETETIKWLLDILEATHQYCVLKQQDWMEELRKILYVNKDETVPDFVMKFIKENRKTKADGLLETEYQEFKEMLSQPTSKVAEMALSIPDYSKECFKVCYLMSIQDPPVVLDTMRGDMLDTKKYKQYTEKGEKIDFMVWPCLLLCKDGAVLCRGTVQCIPSTKCSVNAKHASLDKQSILVEKQETQRQQEQDEARISQKTVGIEGSHVNQSGNADEVHGNVPGSQRVAKSPAENQRSGFSGNTDVKQDHQSANEGFQIDSGNPSGSLRNDKVEEGAGSNGSTTVTFDASAIQKDANSSE